MFIVGPSVQPSTGLVLLHTTPLLEEEGNILTAALPENGKHPFLFHGPCPEAALAANYHPIDPTQIELSEIFEQRFDGQKPHPRGSLSQACNARNPISSVFNAHTYPNLRESAQPTQFLA